MTGLTLRLLLALALAIAVPASAWKGPRRRPSPAARWRRRVGARGVTLSVLPLNLPHHARATTAQQAAWVARRMRRTDAATIAECTPELARAINALPGLACRLAPPNFGGNGNAIVVNTSRVGDVEFSDYAVGYTATSGQHFRLHMARARFTKGGVRVALDGIHAASRPSSKRYKTEAYDEERTKIFQQIARHEPGDVDVWLLGGDTNWLARQVVRALRSVGGRKWKHLGGRGVEQLFGKGATRLLSRPTRYTAGVSDHQITAKVTVGARRR